MDPVTPDDQKWYYNPETGEVLAGKQGSWTNRMGPYDSEDEARHAMDTAKQRNREADALDREDDSWGAAPSWGSGADS
ncbi:hypothetical protein [Corynebacterium pygosceleis]|uniref:SPOR domain-containing protein n=1 Tax=Corynebacterium pygosceleis TaxID=2800406 RepID=A0A9Q4GJN8_9CORY|nr:hypothetical protein [Corynebacterium pygosceleis]MCK7636579.1 hypothetical protein [Corynebacterium pygosceleis]MCK7675153.1 hypothetical protein [Corynebacterium pygosceleis]MCL0120630.1 hypothetical protein [Corynebacterium pygosceleis]MCX7444185.1 hypothetical protein [Corynebacterium pygosceleis]MCX7467332.1 hypothetical protein [Corynebacterium pygosceleis]